MASALAGVAALAALGAPSPLRADDRSSCPMPLDAQLKSIRAFAPIASFLTKEPRCVNCHGGVNPIHRRHRARCGRRERSELHRRTWRRPDPPATGNSAGWHAADRGRVRGLPQQHGSQTRRLEVALDDGAQFPLVRGQGRDHPVQADQASDPHRKRVPRAISRTTTAATTSGRRRSKATAASTRIRMTLRLRRLPSRMRR